MDHQQLWNKVEGLFTGYRAVHGQEESRESLKAIGDYVLAEAKRTFPETHTPPGHLELVRIMVAQGMRMSREEYLRAARRGEINKIIGIKEIEVRGKTAYWFPRSKMLVCNPEFYKQLSEDAEKWVKTLA